MLNKVIIALTMIFIITTISFLEIYVLEPDEEPMKQLHQILFILTMLVFFLNFIGCILFIIAFCQFAFCQSLTDTSEDVENLSHTTRILKNSQVDESVKNTTRYHSIL